MEGQKILCQDPPFIFQPNNCRVFSFGIGMDRFDFELNMANSGCKVSIFDPEADEVTIEEMHKNFDMEPLRLGYEDKQEMRGVDSLHEWKRMSSIVDTISITNRTFYVDYLKLNVKNDEVNFLKEITSKRSRTLVRFKQINIKIHLGVKGTSSWADASRYYKYFIAMERKGYRLFSSTVDPVQHKRYIIPELNRIAYSHYDLVWGKC
ncbi:Methyltransferase domain, partial [Trinorchestia longiramus]